MLFCVTLEEVEKSVRLKLFKFSFVFIARILHAYTNTHTHSPAGPLLYKTVNKIHINEYG